MGRLMPTECKHGTIVDWGDFGPCQDCDEHEPGECPNWLDCEQCGAERAAITERRSSLVTELRERADALHAEPLRRAKANYLTADLLRDAASEIESAEGRGGA